MLKVRVKIFAGTEHIAGSNDRGDYSFYNQMAQIDGGDKAPSLPFAISHSKVTDAHEAGFYDGILIPTSGRFRNSLEWKFDTFVKAS